MQIPKVSNTRFPCFGSCCCCCFCWWWWWRGHRGLHTNLYHQNKVVCSICQGGKSELSSGDQSWLITSASIVLSSDLSAEQLAKEEPGPAGAISPTDHLEPAPGDNNRAGQVGRLDSPAVSIYLQILSRQCCLVASSCHLKVSLFSIVNRYDVVSSQAQAECIINRGLSVLGR